MRIGNLGWFVVLLAFPALGTSAGADQWPRFRGPNGTGISEDKDIPVQWTEQNGVLWKTAIPGEGHSSPVVWDNFVFLQSASADGKERQLLCLSAADGKVLWSRSVPASTAHMHPKNTLASSTPATDGQRVYAEFWDGANLSVTAFDFKGALQWQRDLGPFKSQHGAGASPIVYQDKVILTNDQDGSSVLLALEAATGKTLWQAARQGFRACYSSPFVRATGAGKEELVVVSTAGITAYDPQTGTQSWNWTWHFAGSPLRTIASPVSAQDLIFANSGDGSGERSTVAIQVGGNGAAAEPHQVWGSTKKSFPYVPSMLIRGEHVYYVNDQGIAGCQVVKTGENVWTQRLGANVTASPVLIDGTIYAASEAGDVYVFQAAPTFKLLARNSVGEPVLATPAVADHHLFIRGQAHLFCIGKPAEKSAAGR